MSDNDSAAEDRVTVAEDRVAFNEPATEPAGEPADGVEADATQGDDVQEAAEGTPRPDPAQFPDGDQVDSAAVVEPADSYQAPADPDAEPVAESTEPAAEAAEPTGPARQGRPAFDDEI